MTDYTMHENKFKHENMNTFKTNIKNFTHLQYHSIFRNKGNLEINGVRVKDNIVRVNIAKITRDKIFINEKCTEVLILSNGWERNE